MGIGDLPDWLSLGMGVVQSGSGLGSGDNGVSVQSESISYHLDGLTAQGTHYDYPIISVTGQSVPHAAMQGESVEGFASISLMGEFDPADEGPPVLANVGLRCDEQRGPWGELWSLNFTADGMDSPGGTKEDPHLQFRCRLELRVAGPPTDVVFHFSLDVNQYGMCQFLYQDFEYGRANIFSEGPALALYYDVSEHG